jgi:hypothetical protein
MKKGIVIVLSLLPSMFGSIEHSWSVPEECSFEQHKKQVISKLIQIESEGKHDAVGDRGSAIGVLQIRPIMVKEVNRLIGYKKYHQQDRWDSIKSVEMFIDFQELTNPDWDEELAVRRWNGGIRGENNPKTNYHYQKYIKL